jgi:hypothetical protein
MQRLRSAVVEAVLNVVLLIVGALVGVGGTVLAQGLLNRPKIRMSGGGGGMGPVSGFRLVYLTVENEPGFLSLRLGQTTILGRRIHNGKILFSLPFQRLPAYQCTAWVKEQGAPQGVGLSWRVPGGSWGGGPITIEPGTSAQLGVFARQDPNPNPVAYFSYPPTSNTDETPRIPPPQAAFTGARTFELWIDYLYGRKRNKYELSIYIDPGGNLQFQMPNGSSIF